MDTSESKDEILKLREKVKDLEKQVLKIIK